MRKTTKRMLSLLLAALMLLTALPLMGLDGLLSAETAQAASYKTGDIIKFGGYPQSRVTDSATLAALDAASKNWISYQYYSGNGKWRGDQMQPGDYMRYADITLNGGKYRAVTFDTYRPYIANLQTSTSTSDQNQSNNGYTCGNTYYFRYESLQWRVLDPAAGLVLCENIIDSQEYQNTIYFVYNVYTYYYQDNTKSTYANDYAKSSLRQWLINDFYNTAFSGAEQSLIKETVLDNSAYSSSYARYNSASTTDKIFLLSWSEARNTAYGFSSIQGERDDARLAYGTDYAKCQGLCVNSSYNGSSDWWLRSPGSYDYSAAHVLSSGRCYSDKRVYASSIGVRPAFRFKSGIQQSSNPNGGNGVDESSESLGTLTYDFNGGILESDMEKKSDTVEITEGDSIILQDYHLQKDGYIYGGWGTEPDSLTGYAVGTEYKVSGDEETLYAIWLCDTDGDGFADEWETNGMDTDGDGNPDFFLDVMGADPKIPDIFVQVDWMTIPASTFIITWKEEKSLRPTPAAMQMVYNAFNAHGIHIHIDWGPDSVDFANNNTLWGSLGEGKCIEYQETLDSDDDNNYKGWIELANKNFSEARKKVFHHCIFVDAIKTIETDNNGNNYEETGRTGISAGVPGQYFMVAAGRNGIQGLDPDIMMIDNDIALAGTFMHELGHNLGLWHGGYQCNANNNPNHISIMNYNFSSLGIHTTDGRVFIDYSDMELDTLDETALKENSGVDSIGKLAGTGLMTTWATKNNRFEFVSAEGSIDFNEDGQIQNSVRNELNGNGINDFADRSKQSSEEELNSKNVKLRGFNDWAYLVDESGEDNVYCGPTITSMQASDKADGNGELAADLQEPTFEELINDGMLASPGTVHLEPKCITYFSNTKDQEAIFELVNLGATDLDVKIHFTSNIIRNGHQNFYCKVKGTYGSIGSATMHIPLVNNLSAGSHVLKGYISGEGVKEQNLTIYIKTIKMTEEMQNTIIDLEKNGSNAAKEIPSDVLNQMIQIAKSLPPDVDPTELFLPGDVNADGAIGADDARLALRRSVDLENYPEDSAQFLACDVNRDNAVGADDARLILRASVDLEDPATWG
ncbi:MAG: InlB B-repeat-containing protein [Clostridia bacterium]|nr:InlB B-repeat-containing protein [Clostridia bacterium]